MKICPRLPKLSYGNNKSGLHYSETRCILFRARGKHINVTKQNGERYILFSLIFMEIISTRKGIVRGVFLAKHLADTDN